MELLNYRVQWAIRVLGSYHKLTGLVSADAPGSLNRTRIIAHQVARKGSKSETDFSAEAESKGPRGPRDHESYENSIHH